MTRLRDRHDPGDEGVVNAAGEAYDAGAEDPAALHEGLMIVDASVLSGALITHATMTILAQAGRPGVLANAGGIDG